MHMSKIQFSKNNQNWTKIASIPCCTGQVPGRLEQRLGTTGLETSRTFGNDFPNESSPKNITNQSPFSHLTNNNNINKRRRTWVNKDPSRITSAPRTHPDKPNRPPPKSTLQLDNSETSQPLNISLNIPKMKEVETNV